jgi:hypothetical protein
MPLASIIEQNGNCDAVCPAPNLSHRLRRFFAAPFPASIVLLQARPMSVRRIIVIPITGPASA